MTNHLVKRGSRYSIRRKIPADLQAHYERKEIVRALGTSDPAEARTRCREESVKLDKEFEAVRQALKSAGQTSPTYTRAEYDEWLRTQHEDHRQEEGPAQSLRLEVEDARTDARYDESCGDSLYTNQTRTRLGLETRYLCPLPLERRHSVINIHLDSLRFSTIATRCHNCTERPYLVCDARNRVGQTYGAR
jgi:hypothetical protein